MRELKVDPAEVHRSGVEVGEIAAAVTSAFTNSDTEIASAGPGWMGKSAAALASMAAEWHAVWIVWPKSSSSTEATSRGGKAVWSRRIVRGGFEGRCGREHLNGRISDGF